MTHLHLWTPLRAMLLLALVAGLLFAACGGDDDDDAADDNAGGMSGHEMTDEGGGDVDPDLAFIDAMIVHHSSAIAMAELAGEHAEHDEIRELADEIIAAQSAEIEQLQAWRDDWFADAPKVDLAAMQDMPGMNMTADDEQMLRDADPFDAMFIEMMIPHHESAITMAEDLQASTDRPELQELAEEIITAQQAEIEQMREWQAEWFGTS
jgi:uncharacterized protein (DUF305 family)